MPKMSFCALFQSHPGPPCLSSVRPCRVRGIQFFPQVLPLLLLAWSLSNSFNKAIYLQWSLAWFSIFSSAFWTSIFKFSWVCLAIDRWSISVTIVCYSYLLFNDIASSIFILFFSNISFSLIKRLMVAANRYWRVSNSLFSALIFGGSRWRLTESSLKSNLLDRISIVVVIGSHLTVDVECIWVNRLFFAFLLLWLSLTFAFRGHFD